MKRVKWLCCVLTILIAGSLTNMGVQAEEEHGHGHEGHFDKKAYEKIVKKSMGAILTGNINADKLIASMRGLIEMGEEACEAHLQEVDTPEEVKILEAIKANADNMPSLTTAQIEAQWIKGEAFKAKGVDVDKIDQLSETWSHVYTIVQPALVISSLNEYKKTGSQDLIEKVKGELIELRSRLKRLE